jgi:hypothetical protein
MGRGEDAHGVRLRCCWELEGSARLPSSVLPTPESVRTQQAPSSTSETKKGKRITRRVGR